MSGSGRTGAQEPGILQLLGQGRPGTGLPVVGRVVDGEAEVVTGREAVAALPDECLESKGSSAPAAQPSKRRGRLSKASASALAATSLPALTVRAGLQPRRARRPPRREGTLRRATHPRAPLERAGSMQTLIHRLAGRRPAGRLRMGGERLRDERGAGSHDGLTAHDEIVAGEDLLGKRHALLPLLESTGGLRLHGGKSPPWLRVKGPGSPS